MKKAWMAGLMIMSLALPAFADMGPAATIRNIFETDIRAGVDSLDPGYYSARRVRDIQKTRDACKNRSDVCFEAVDMDIFRTNENGSIENLVVSQQAVTGTRAVVIARFTAGDDYEDGHKASDDRHVTMRFDMVKENGKWLIDQLTGYGTGYEVYTLDSLLAVKPKQSP